LDHERAKLTEQHARATSAVLRTLQAIHEASARCFNAIRNPGSITESLESIEASLAESVEAWSAATAIEAAAKLALERFLDEHGLHERPLY